MRSLLFGTLEHARIQYQIVNLVAAHLLQCLLRKSLDGLQVRQFHGQYGNSIDSVIILQLGDSIIGGLDVSRSNNYFVWRGVFQKLLEHFKALHLFLASSGHRDIG